MKKQRVEKRKSPVITTVRTNETTIDFSGISVVSTGTTIAKEGRGDFKIQKRLYGVPGTVKRERRSAGGGGDI
jgi:hypothetical protein